MNRDDVISHLKIMHTWASFALEHDKYFFNEKHMEDIAKWTLETIDLLKEQEPAAPGILQDFEGIWSTCPRCKSKLWLFFGMTMEINPDHMPKYCPQCGKPIKWGKNKAKAMPGVKENNPD
jgi:hypothetical protein